jgi:hypothetical protein
MKILATRQQDQHRVVALIERAKRMIDAGVDPTTVDDDTAKRIVNGA